MTVAGHLIHTVPIDTITVINPRSRNKKVFQDLVTSIARLGLKKRSPSACAVTALATISFAARGALKPSSHWARK